MTDISNTTQEEKREEHELPIEETSALNIQGGFFASSQGRDPCKTNPLTDRLYPEAETP